MMTLARHFKQSKALLCSLLDADVAETKAHGGEGEILRGETVAVRALVWFLSNDETVGLELPSSTMQVLLRLGFCGRRAVRVCSPR